MRTYTNYLQGKTPGLMMAHKDRGLTNRVVQIC